MSMPTWTRSSASSLDYHVEVDRLLLFRAVHGCSAKQVEARITAEHSGDVPPRQAWWRRICAVMAARIDRRH